jgi:hypothetical protein
MGSWEIHKLNEGFNWKIIYIQMVDVPLPCFITVGYLTWQKEIAYS